MTAIREVELSAPLASIDGLTASRCMLVFRWRGHVIGRTFVPVVAGRIDAPALADAAARSLGVEALQTWLDGELGYDERAVVDPVPLSVTVAICTRERPEDLQRALAAVERLHWRPFEVLVVDNAPVSGATQAVVERCGGVRYVREPTRGLNAARNRALAEAAGDIVAFTDDDATPEPGWLNGLLANFQDPRVLCVTGLTLPAVLDTDAQELFEEHCTFVRGFRRRVFDGQRDNPLAVGPVGAGANMAMRREAVLRLGGFDDRLDGGLPTRSGGDHEMFARILASGCRIVYEPDAVSWHRHRRTIAELHETVYGYGVGVYAMWTGLLLERHEIGVIKLAWQWFRHSQLPAMLDRREQKAEAARLARAEFRGCMYGPRAWFAARRLRATQR